MMSEKMKNDELTEVSGGNAETSSLPPFLKCRVFCERCNTTRAYTLTDINDARCQANQLIAGQVPCQKCGSTSNWYYEEL